METKNLYLKILPLCKCIVYVLAEIYIDCRGFLAKLLISFLWKLIFKPHSDKSGKQLYTTVDMLIEKPSADLKIIINASHTE